MECMQWNMVYFKADIHREFIMAKNYYNTMLIRHQRKINPYQVVIERMHCYSWSLVRLSVYCGLDHTISKKSGINKMKQIPWSQFFNVFIYTHTYIHISNKYWNDIYQTVDTTYEHQVINNVFFEFSNTATRYMYYFFIIKGKINMFLIHEK